MSRAFRFREKYIVYFLASFVFFSGTFLFLPGIYSFGAEEKGKVPSSSPSAQAPIPGNPIKNAPKGETTTDFSSLSVDRYVMFVRLEKGFYQIREIIHLQNSGKATIVSKNGAPTLRFVLPKSSNIREPDPQLMGFPQGLDRTRTRLAGDMVLSDEPIPPGIKLVGLSYRLADEFGGITLQKPFTLGAKSFAFLPEKDRVQAGVEGLTRSEDLNFQGVTYETYVGAAQRGSSLRITLKAPESMGRLEYFYAVAAGLAVLGGILAVVIRQRRKKGLGRQVEREELLRSLAALDDRLAQGDISPEDHQRQRVPRFERLRELSR